MGEPDDIVCGLVYLALDELKFVTSAERIINGGFTVQQRFGTKGRRPMRIQEMNRDASLSFLARRRLGHLACVRDGQPYITPLFFAHEDDALYSFSTFGQKIEWMRANPHVCVEAEEVESAQKWATVIIFGAYEELPDTPEYANSRRLAHTLLQRQPLWWQPGYTGKASQNPETPDRPIYFRIHIHRVSGRIALPD